MNKLSQRFKLVHGKPEDWYEEEKACKAFHEHAAASTGEWEPSLVEAVASLLGRVDEERQMVGLVSKLTARVDALERTLPAVQAGGSIVVPILTLDPAPFELLKEIKAVVRPSDDEFVATFFDANVNASGCTMTDAVSNLKEMLVTRFDYLAQMPIEKLGPAMVKQIAVLRGFIRRRA